MTDVQNRTIIRRADDNHHLVLDDGQALYRFAPMKHDPLHQTILWGDEWPVYLRAWVLNWIPVAGKPKAGRGVSQQDLGTTSRKGAKHFDYPQVTYRGWWLYVWNEEGPGEAHPVAGLWVRVTHDVPDLEGGPTEPPTYNGGP